jgi:hypothetical protein
MLPGRIPPPETITIDEGDAAEHATIINPRPPMAFGKKRLKPKHLLIHQPIQVAHIQCPEPESDHPSQINGS